MESLIQDLVGEAIAEAEDALARALDAMEKDGCYLEPEDLAGRMRTLGRIIRRAWVIKQRLDPVGNLMEASIHPRSLFDR